MASKPKTGTVKIGTNLRKRARSFITKKNNNNNNPKEISPGKKPSYFLSKLLHPKNNLLFSKLILVVLIAILIISGVVVFNINNKSKKATTKQGVRINCSEQSTKDCMVLKEAVKLLDPSKVKELSAVVEKIKKIKGYDKDPNLLYVILTYYINLSDGNNARKTYDLLKGTYK